ncbi:hypothetical protein ACTXG7_19535 [Mycolicibacterium sp. Dal123E01]|uniref:hypothetical protein n=1 Tax=Mycolicibacterium sp. Dal123E01 TaxID=3457578 RepID=UPI00403E88C2
MRPGFPRTAVRPLAAAAAAGILTLGLVTAPPAAAVALPRTEVHAVALATFTTVGFPTPVTPTSAPRPAAASQTANDTSEPPDFLAFAASILEYLNSLGFGAGPGLAAIGLSGFVVAFAATAYAWNAFANTVNPGLRFLRVPPVPKFPVCFAGQKCATSTASAQARATTPAVSPVKPASRGVATSKRDPSAARSNSSTAATVRGTKKSAPSAASSVAKGTSKRDRTAGAH